MPGLQARAGGPAALGHLNTARETESILPARTRSAIRAIPAGTTLLPVCGSGFLALTTPAGPD
jgi:hypothetical protein